MIEIINLTKKFRDFTAVDRLTLSVKPGEIFGFLGPNGAGKTTTLKLLMGLLKPTSGKTLINGNDIQENPREVKRITGYIPDRPYLYDKLTGYEFLKFVTAIYEVRENIESQIDRYLEMFELMPVKHHLIESYSHGMKQKLVLSAALLRQPRVLIIDEPMVGLDPRSARLVKEIFTDLSGNGVTVFLSTHSLELVEKLCHRIGIIQTGRLVALGTMKELKDQARQEAGNLEDIFLSLTGAGDTEPAFPEG